jgi:hypothetical protein
MKNKIVSGLIVLSFVFATYAMTPRTEAAIATISAGSDQSITLPTSSVMLSGSATASTGTTVATYAWTEVSGPVAATIASANAVTTQVTGLTTAGDYIFRLTATDNSTPTAMSNTDDVLIHVQSNMGTVSAGADQTLMLPTSIATLTGVATAMTGASIASYAWSQVSGPVTATIASPTLATTQVTGLTTAGDYVFRLTATDNSAPTPMSYTDDVVIHVRNMSTVKQPKAHLEMDGNGNVDLTGQLTANSNGTLTINVYGIVFTVNTSTSQNVTNFTIGDMINVRGNISTPGTLTFTALWIKDISIPTVDDHRGNLHKNGKKTMVYT